MAKIIGKDLPNIPWQEKPQDYPRPVWRYTENPIIDRYAIPTSNSIFNSAVVPFKDGFAGVFRCDSFGVSMDIYAGFSKDAIHWESTMSQLPLQERIRKSYRDSTVMTQEYVSSRIVITLPGVTAIMVRQSVLHIHLILRLSYSLKMHFYHTIEMVCFSQERSTESMRCCPVQAIQDIHRLAIFSTARARILNTGVIIVL